MTLVTPANAKGPVPVLVMFGRSGFYIHGRGPKGSDGCIVPMESFGPFMAALAKDHGGLLTVAPRIGGAQGSPS